MSAKANLEKLPVVIYTATQRIEGIYYLPVGGRLSDHLNGRQRQQEFIPLTDAKVANLPDEDRFVFESDFITVNLQSIMLLSPKPKRNGG